MWPVRCRGPTRVSQAREAEKRQQEATREGGLAYNNRQRERPDMKRDPDIVLIVNEPKRQDSAAKAKPCSKKMYTREKSKEEMERKECGERRQNQAIWVKGAKKE